MRQIGKALASALKQPKPEETPEVGSAVASAMPQNQTPVTTLPMTGEKKIPSRDMPSLPPGFIGKDGRIVERPVRPPIDINPPQYKDDLDLGRRMFEYKEKLVNGQINPPVGRPLPRPPIDGPVTPPRRMPINPRLNPEGVSKYGDWQRGVNDQYSAWQKNQIDQGKKIGIDFMPSDFYTQNPELVNPPPELAPYAPIEIPMSSGFKNIRKYLGKK